jgi:RimJ/RimL family protein N-acetyltransferase
MALAIETERLTLRLRDERDAAWYRELLVERGGGAPTLEEATARLARFRDAAAATGRHRLWSTVRPSNAASLRVLEKTGFRWDHTSTDDVGDVAYLVRDL